MSCSFSKQPGPKTLRMLSPLYRILIVDDHPMMREGLGTLISRERDLIVCGEAETAGRRWMPSRILSRTRAGRYHFAWPQRHRAYQRHLRVTARMLILVISMHDELLYAERVLRAGARGYIMKQESGPTVIKAIREVLAGRIYLSNKMSAQILENVVGTAPKLRRSSA